MNYGPITETWADVDGDVEHQGADALNKKPRDYEGEVSSDGELNGAWEQNVLGFMDLSGELRMNRISRDTTYYE